MTMPTDPHDQSLEGLSRIAAYLRTDQWQLGQALDLTPTQIAVLQTLGRRGAMRVAALAAQLGVTQATLSDAVTALHAKGLATRDKDPTDRRATLVSPTPAGSDILSRIDPARNALTEVLAGLDPHDRAGLHRVLMKIVLGLQEAGAIAPQRVCVTCRFFRPHAHDDAARPHHCDFVDAAFGDAQLRLDCGDHETADPERARSHWRRFDRGPPA